MGNTGIIPLVVMMLCHLWVAADIGFTHNDWPIALVFFFYACSVTGFMWKYYT